MNIRAFPDFLQDRRDARSATGTIERGRRRKLPWSLPDKPTDDKIDLRRNLAEVVSIQFHRRYNPQRLC
jgi:hypothetical protein